MTRRMAIVTVIALALLVGVLIREDRSTAEPQLMTDAPSAEVMELEELVRKDQRILFDATVTGDFSLYPTIYYNDPSIAMHPDYQSVLKQHGDAAAVALATLTNGPKGGATGYLTARIASLLAWHENAAAWEEIQLRAAAEGRVPSVLDLPEGFSPVEPVRAEDWIEPDYHLFDVEVGGDRATAKLAFGPPEAGGQVFSYVFVRVDSQWYISYMESSWSQGDPEYLKNNPPPTPIEGAP